MRNFGSHPGYLESTAGEREAQYTDLEIILPPLDDGLTLRERIFNDKLVKEFRDRYEEKFGRTEVERAYHDQDVNRFTYFDDVYGFRGTPQEINDERRRFGEFMVRRLAEYHVDNYFKSDPKMRVVWEAKEKLSKMNIEVQQFRFDMNYSIAGNTFDVNVVNPWLATARMRLQMNPDSFGPGTVEEAIVSIGHGVTSTVSIEGHLAVTDGIVTFIGRKAITPALSTSLTTSTFVRDQGKSRRESVYLAGVSFSF